MSTDDVEDFEAEAELLLYREYRDVVGLFRYVVETERRFYLANDVRLTPRQSDGDVFFEILLEDAWVWDVYRTQRFIKRVKVLTFKDVNIEELPRDELQVPPDGQLPD
ncbi:DUF2469 domain-containing protein [Micrococcus endophyticus]|uniref:DUF2469 domain-containing protein n=1 Tax=Micrococcus endophyticus TaxID=455343 RepID=UPI0010C7EF8A|nr:DUF2469 domain-containing protein [Micrococcus endophyticus]MCK6091719.1 DUF2469 domain-containing protein [Micrococcus endophyticus]QCP08278.1 DUF2469 family protein [Micrococcus luteus]